MSQHKLSRSNPRRGGVLVLALVAVSSVAVMAACMLQMSMACMSRQRAAIESKQAFYLAEAGLTEAYLGLSIGKTGNVGRPDRPAVFGGGLFWVEATQQAPRRVRLESTAMFAGSRTVLAMLAERGEVSVAEVTASARAAIDKANPDVRAIIEVYEDRFEAPDGGLCDGPMRGVPFLVKD